MLIYYQHKFATIKPNIENYLIFKSIHVEIVERRNKETQYCKSNFINLRESDHL